MAKHFFIKRGTKVLGPMTPNVVKQAIGKGKVRQSDLISGAASGPWKQIADIPALANLFDVQVDDDDYDEDEYGAYGDDAYGQNEEYASLPMPTSKRKKKTHSQGDSRREADTSDVTSLQASGITKGTLALLGVGGVLFCAIVIGGIVLLLGQFDSGSGSLKSASEFAPNSSVATFGWVSSLPEIDELSAASKSENPIRSKSAADRLRQSLQTCVGHEVQWEFALADIEEDMSSFACLRNGGTRSAPVLIVAYILAGPADLPRKVVPSAMRVRVG